MGVGTTPSPTPGVLRCPERWRNPGGHGPARGGEAGAAAWSGRKVLQGVAKLLKTPLRLWARGDGLTVLLPMGVVAQRPPLQPFPGDLVDQGETHVYMASERGVLPEEKRVCNPKEVATAQSLLCALLERCVYVCVQVLPCMDACMCTCEFSALGVHTHECLWFLCTGVCICECTHMFTSCHTLHE